MIEDIERVRSEAAVAVAGTVTLEELQALDTELLGKRSALSAFKKQLGQLDPDQRRHVGQALNAAQQQVRDLLADRRAALQTAAQHARLDAERLDLTEVIPTGRAGHIHLVTQALNRLEDVFVGMGFVVAEGPEVEDDWHNFGALNFPPGHPARDMYDTLYVDLGEPGSTLLRTHTSPVQIRFMESQGPPIYAVMPGRVFRSDTADASHMPVFHQIEGLVVDRDITFGHLAGTIDAFTKAYFGGEINSRLRPSYFPFTEPSAEFDINCTQCKGSGCKSCGYVGWLELGGCGMVHPNVLAAGGVDAEEFSGFAFGFGIDRLATARHGIDDLRDLFTNDVRFLEQF